MKTLKISDLWQSFRLAELGRDRVNKLLEFTWGHQVNFESLPAGKLYRISLSRLGLAWLR